MEVMFFVQVSTSIFASSNKKQFLRCHILLLINLCLDVQFFCATTYARCLSVDEPHNFLSFNSSLIVPMNRDFFNLLFWFLIIRTSQHRVYYINTLYIYFMYTFQRLNLLWILIELFYLYWAELWRVEWI